MIWLKCPRPNCGNIWQYKGKNKIQVTCPDCMRKMPIEGNAAEEKDGVHS